MRYGLGLAFVNPDDAKRFTVGTHWHSHDNGSTWLEGECSDPPRPVKSTLTVEKIDHESGAVTMILTPAP